MSDFVYVIMIDESCEDGYIHKIYATKELALKELNKLAKERKENIYDDYFMSGGTTYSIDEYEVFQSE